MNEVSTVSEGGVTVTSTSETPEQIKAIISPSETKAAPDISEAASELGKKGGQASAEARAAKAKEKAEGAEETAPEVTTAAPATKPAETDDTADIRNPTIKARIEAKAREAQDYRKQLEAERTERQRLAAEVAALRAGKPAETPQTEATVAKAEAQMPGVDPRDPRPKSEDFSEWSDYEDARDLWHDRRRERVASQRSAAQERGKALNTTVDTFLERVAGVPKTDPSMVEKFSAFTQTLSPEVQNLRGSFQREKDAQGRYTQPLDQTHIMADEIIRSDRARDLMLYLSEHPDVFQRIAALESAPDIVREMAKLHPQQEAKPDGATAGTRVVAAVSQAKPPVRPVTGSPHTADSVPGPDASYEDHKRYWSRRDRERQAQR